MSLQINSGDRVLIVAPHPDDESIGCGGLMLKYGSQCEILLLTDGRKGYDTRVSTDEDALVIQRAQELQSAAAIAGINRIHMLRIPDCTLAEHMELVSSFDFTPYQFVFVPNHYERHKDHAPVSKLVQSICKRQSASAEIYEYEVWSPLPSYTDVLDLDGLMERKLDMVRQYQSQLRFLDYESMTEALNRYRGAGQKRKYAEVYANIPKVSAAKKMYHKKPAPVRKGLRKIRGIVR